MDGALPFFVIADLGHVEAAARGGPVAPVRIALPDDAAAAMAHGLPVLHLPFPGPATPGRPQPAQAGAVVEAIARAVAEVQAGRAAALCTLPIHKAALKSGAGFAFPGHTEYLAHLAGGGAHPVMMLAAEALDPPLRVVPATVHVPLSAVPGLVSPALIEETIRITHAGLVRDFGIPRPRIAVAGLNPHAGESGHDAVVAMYHDQALIPLKTLDFAGGVNVTLGLPLVRTSPDHGTALDIAGRGVADASSLVAALRLAARMAAARGVAR
ncbi:MAG: 4-hydroxythreonine-4-phosphate dehydrogenase [Alphaproteobacteria bacterium HGW-Alphaproteobacteria-2]|nr:MAG: 4-hydroxythreonine-4-phosphate dehydrogenase [Alphaproteobacteria bacterium HGW-Alphaproteobacteria-2]